MCATSTFHLHDGIVGHVLVFRLDLRLHPALVLLLRGDNDHGPAHHALEGAHLAALRVRVHVRLFRTTFRSVRATRDRPCVVKVKVKVGVRVDVIQREFACVQKQVGKRLTRRWRSEEDSFVRVVDGRRRD